MANTHDAGPVLDAYGAAIAAGQHEQALTLALKEVVHLPDKGLSALQKAPVWDRMVALAPTWTRELAVIDQLDADLAPYRQLAAPTLLLVGTETQAHHKAATRALAAMLPNVHTVELHDQGHAAHIRVPGVVTQAVARFLHGDA